MREVVRFINPYDPGLFPEDLPMSNVLQLGSNENPYEPSDEVKKAYMESLKHIRLYPHAAYRKLKEAIAEYLNVDAESIAVGCGASELINCICMALIEELDSVVIPVPSYTLYAIYAMLRNASIHFPRFDRYNVKADVIAEFKPKLTFLCSPNNPTGNTIDRKVVEEVAEVSQYVVVDEAYVEFAKKSCIDLVSELENLIILRSFSKFFGSAGMRIGYVVANKNVAEALEKIRLPFAISYPALNTAIAALKSIDYYEMIRDKIVAERERVFAEISAIPFLKPYPSEANFILVKVERDGLAEKLLKEGIIVRDVSKLMGLDGEHVRITIGKPEENDRLLDALKSSVYS